jgi:uncharacterized membrane protein YphA (DoxX/SURF4 family)
MKPLIETNKRALHAAILLLRLMTGLILLVAGAGKNFFLGGPAYPCLLFVICLVLILPGRIA